MLFALLPYAPRLRAVLLGVAFAFSGWCHGQTVPDLRVLETGPGLFELIWNDAGENWVLETSPDLGSSEPWLLFSELPALNNGFYSVPVEGLPAPQFFRLRQDEPDPIDPDAPVYEPLPDQAVFPGETLTFAIRAVDPNGLRVTYLVENLPLPQGALLNTSTGAFTFTPTESQIGTHPIIFLATNGIQTSRLRVNVLVQQPQGPSTSLSGILLDTTDAVNGTSTPIRGATIALLGTGVTTTTGADGRFTLNDTPAGLQVIDMDTSTADLAPDGSPYAGFREAIRIVANLDNVVERPFYLPRIERASLTKTEPNFTTTVRNERLGITLTVPPHTAMREGEEFEGDLSISEVPESLAPANLPDFLDPALLITIQPVGVRFNDPVPVTFPNIDDLAPGSETDIWSLDPDRGIFTVVGTGRVTEDGQFIETIRGGVIAADWHATLPPAPPTSPPPPPPCPDCCPAGGFGPSGSGSGAGPSGPAPFGGLSWNDPEFRESSPWIWGRPWDFGDGTRGLPREDPWTPAADSATTLYAGALPDAGASLIQFSSQASPATGTLMTQFSTPATVEAGASRQITFNYRSDWAFPHSAIPVDGTILFQSAVPRTISYDYILGGMMEDREVYASTTGFSENRDEPFRLVATFSTQALPTGLYPYTIRLHSNFAFSTRSTAVSGLFANVHADENGLGHGWGIAGLQRIHADWDSGRLMVVDGGGTISLFSDSVANSTFVVGGFSANRAADFSFTEGAHYSDARAFLQQTFPFLEMASFAELTTASLAGIDILILNPLAGSTVGNPLSDAEQAALLQFLEEGGSAVLTVDHDLERAGFQLAIGSMLEPLSLEVENHFGAPVNVTSEDLPLSGEFGTVGQVAFPFGGARFTDLGPWAEPLADSTIAIVKDNVIAPNAGRVVVIGDIQSFLTSDAVGLNFSPDNSTLLANSIEYCLRRESADRGIVFSGLGEEHSQVILDPAGTFTRAYLDGRRAAFDRSGLLRQIVEPSGKTTNLRYDGDGLLLSVTWPSGEQTEFKYADGLITRLVNPAGHVTAFEHDTSGDLTRVVFPGGGAREFGYDGRHLMIAETDERGSTTTREYDDFGCIVEAVLPNGAVRRLQPSSTVGAVPPGSLFGTEDNPAPPTRPADAVGSFTDGLGETTAFTFHPGGASTSVMDSLGTVKVFERDAAGNPVREIAPDGTVIERVYDQNGGVLEETFLGIPGVDDPAFPTSTRYTYHPNGRVATFTAADASVASVDFDAQNRPSAYNDTVGTTTALVYEDPRHPDQFTTLTQAAGTPFESSVLFEHDARTGLASAYTDVMGETATFSYDEAGNLAEETDFEGNTVRYQYDAYNRITKFIDSRNSEPDPAAGSIGVYTYDYDASGNLTRIVDSKGIDVSLFEYDGQNRLTKRTDALGNAESITYDLEGRIVSTTDRNGQRIDYAYDVRDRVTEKLLAPGTAQETAIVFEYGDAPFPMRIASPDSVLTFTYDAMDRITSVSTADSPHQPDVTINYVYDQSRRLVQMTDPTGSTSYAYDTRGGLTALTNPSGHQIQFGYDLLGRLTEIQRPNGTESIISYHASDTEATYDNRQTADGSVFAGFEYAYNAEGHPVSVEQTLPDIAAVADLEFAYDSLYRLVEATHPVPGQAEILYTYDEVGNRLRKTGQAVDAVFDDEDRLLEDADFVCTYDLNGNPITRTSKASGRVERFGYDPENRLRSVEVFPDASAGVPSSSSTYIYDVLGRRIVKNVDGEITRYIYDGSSILLEYSADDELLARYTHGPLVDQPVIMERDQNGNATFEGDEAYFYHTDRLGNVVCLTDGLGSVAQSYVYDAFGAIVALGCGGATFTGEFVRTELAGDGCLTNPFTFTGREYDPESGFYHFRARAFDAETGRFLQHDIYAGNHFRNVQDDPSVRSVVMDVSQFAFDGGQRSHYAYVDNTPLSVTDPSGMGWWSWWCGKDPTPSGTGVKTVCTSNTPLGVGEGAAIVEGLVDVAGSGAVENRFHNWLINICANTDNCGYGCYEKETEVLACQLETKFRSWPANKLGGALKFLEIHKKEIDKLNKMVKRDKCANGCK